MGVVSLTAGKGSDGRLLAFLAIVFIIFKITLILLN